MRRGTPAKTGQTRARVGGRARARSREAAASPSPLAALGRDAPSPASGPAAPGAPRPPGALRHDSGSDSGARGNWESPRLPGPRVPSRARRGDRGVGARAPASAAVTPSSPRAPRTPTQPPLTVDVPESQLIAQLREGLHGLQNAQLAALIHRPARRTVPREVQLRETRRRDRRHRP